MGAGGGKKSDARRRGGGWVESMQKKGERSSYQRGVD